jgi:hypothetical protein
VLRDRVRDALQKIAVVVRGVSARPDCAREYGQTPPLLRLVSALAEGADQIVAEVGLELGYELQAPIPYAADEYKKDFADPKPFDQLLSRASAALQLDGRREEDARAYERVGHVLLAQSDLLIAIWDGEPAQGIGGTGAVVADAIGRGIPVVWIHSRPPHDCVVFLHHADDGATRKLLADIEEDVERVLVPPPNDTDNVIGDEYWSERTPRPRQYGVYRLFQLLMAPGTRPIPNASPPDPSLCRQLPDSPTERERLWVDALADRYASRYRNAFVAVYGLGVFASFAALLGYVSVWATVVEGIVIVWILSLIVRERLGRWSKRWLHYRQLAEQLRQLELLWPIGRVLPSFRVPAHAADDDPSHAWVNWLFRARVREMGLVNAHLSPSYLHAYRECRLRPRIDEQVTYHLRTADRNGRLEHNVRVWASALFGATLLVCVGHMLHNARWHTLYESLADAAGWENAALTLIAVLLPAIGAAFAGIASQSEFARLVRQSKAMAHRLGTLRVQLERSSAPLRSDSISKTAEAVTELMTAELVAWQSTFRLKVLEPV